MDSVVLMEQLVTPEQLEEQECKETLVPLVSSDLLEHREIKDN